MTMQVRRVVTGHDENGNAVVVSDGRLTAVSRGVGTGISGCEMWSTNRMPIDNSAAADAAQRAGFVNHYIHANYVGTGAGTTFRITELAPGHAKFTLRTEIADYVVGCRARLTSISRPHSVLLGPGRFGRMRKSPWRWWSSFRPCGRALDKTLVRCLGRGCVLISARFSVG